MRLLDNQVFITHYFKPTYDFSVVFISSGWGRLAYYDPDEHKLTNNSKTLARISKMASEWKIIHDFKPTAAVFPSTTFGLVLSSSEPRVVLSLEILHPTSTSVYLRLVNTAKSVDKFVAMNLNQLPTLNKWNRIEITYEEEGGKYFLSFSVNGRTSNKEEVGDDLVLGSLKGDFKEVEIFTFGYEDNQPWIIKGITVLEKF